MATTLEGKVRFAALTLTPYPSPAAVERGVAPSAAAADRLRREQGWRENQRRENVIAGNMH